MRAFQELFDILTPLLQEISVFHLKRLNYIDNMRTYFITDEISTLRVGETNVKIISFVIAKFLYLSCQYSEMHFTIIIIFNSNYYSCLWLKRNW